MSRAAHHPPGEMPSYPSVHVSGARVCGPGYAPSQSGGLPSFPAGNWGSVVACVRGRTSLLTLAGPQARGGARCSWWPPTMTKTSSSCTRRRTPSPSSAAAPARPPPISTPPPRPTPTRSYQRQLEFSPFFQLIGTAFALRDFRTFCTFDGSASCGRNARLTGFGGSGGLAEISRPPRARKCNNSTKMDFPGFGCRSGRTAHQPKVIARSIRAQ